MLVGLMLQVPKKSQRRDSFKVARSSFTRGGHHENQFYPPTSFRDSSDRPFCFLRLPGPYGIIRAATRVPSLCPVQFVSCA